MRQVGHRGITRHSAHALVTRIHREDRALEAAAKQVGEDARADSFGPIGRTDERDRARLEQRLEVVGPGKRPRDGVVQRWTWRE